MSNINALIPIPQEIKLYQGEYLIEGIAHISEEIANDKAVINKLNYLNIAYRITSSIKGYRLVISLDEKYDDIECLSPNRFQAYSMNVNEKGIVIDGFDIEGLFWGLITLEQLL